MAIAIVLLFLAILSKANRQQTKKWNDNAGEKRRCKTKYDAD